jgi:hypothetical protein
LRRIPSASIEKRLRHGLSVKVTQSDAKRDPEDIGSARDKGCLPQTDFKILLPNPDEEDLTLWPISFVARLCQ